MEKERLSARTDRLRDASCPVTIQSIDERHLAEVLGGATEGDALDSKESDTADGTKVDKKASGAFFLKVPVEKPAESQAEKKTSKA